MTVFSLLMSIFIFILSTNSVLAGQDFIGIEEDQVQSEHNKVLPVFAPILENIESLLTFLNLSQTINELEQTIYFVPTLIKAQNNVLGLTDLPPPSSL